MPPLPHRAGHQIPQVVHGAVEDAAVDRYHGRQMYGEQRTLAGRQRPVAVPERRGELVNLLGVARRLFGHSVVVPPLQRSPGPGPNFFDQRGRESVSIVHDKRLPPAWHDGANGAGIPERLATAFLERACAHRNEKAVAAFQSPGGLLRPDLDDFEGGLRARASRAPLPARRTTADAPRSTSFSATSLAVERAGSGGRSTSTAFRRGQPPFSAVLTSCFSELRA